jgi:CubicO group peptidase (beta-lactamase class C family)
VAKAQAEARMPSLVAAVLREGAVAWSGVRGRVAQRGVPPSPRMQYRIGSISKTMTAALVMQLRDEGALDLADPIGRHLPDAPYPDRSVRALLAHSSGLQAEPTGPWWERSPGVDWTQLVTAHEGAVGVLPAGRQYHYSNLAFGLLGELAARLRRCGWFEAVGRFLLQPLQMRRTTYSPAAPHAQGFSVDALTGVLTAEPSHDTGAMAAAGQLWSTVDDLCRWLGVLLAPDDRVLAGDTVTEMTTPQSGAPGEASVYGLGVRLSRAGERLLIGHTGSMPGFLAGMFGDPESGVGAVVLANGTVGLDVEHLPRLLIETVLAHEPVLPAEWVPPDAVHPMLAELAGMWFWGNTALVASVEHGDLVLSGLSTRMGPGRPSRLRVDGPDRLVGLDGYYTGETLRVVRRDDGSVSHLDLATFVLTRVAYDPRAPIPGGS